jgi:hypothetical protein
MALNFTINTSLNRGEELDDYLKETEKIEILL